MNRTTQLGVFAVVVMAHFGLFADPAVTNLPENRILQFNDYTLTNNTATPLWVHEGTTAPGGLAAGVKALLKGTNHYHRTGWVLQWCRTGCSAYKLNYLNVPPVSPATMPPDPYIATNLAANMQNDLHAQIESPVLTNGAGTVYFEAINGDPSYPTEITVEIATNMTNNVGSVTGLLPPPSTNGFMYVWQTLYVTNLSALASSDFTRYVRPLNFRQPVKLRIRRTGTVYPALSTLDGGYAVIDNIRVSPPPADVVVSGTSAQNDSGGRSIRCFVSDVDTNAPATNRVLTAYYRWLTLPPPDNAWTNVPMSLFAAGTNEQYKAFLPFQPLGGDLEYYVVCNFGGFRYQSPDYTGLGYTNYLPEGRSALTTAPQTNFFERVGVYTLTVTNGTGTGTQYTNGQQVAVAASNLTGMGFARWTGDTLYVADVTSPSTTVTMPAFSIGITATYTNLYYTLTVNSGSGGGSYTNGQQVAITASNVVGMLFDRWTGATQQVASVTSPGTTVTMPASDIVLTATYVKTYTLTVVSGINGGSYTNGQQVAIAASNLTDTIFDRWTGDTNYVTSVTSPNTTVTMPNRDITLTATYINLYRLTVTSGIGGGTYTNGQQVAVTASNLNGKVFDRWTGATANMANPSAFSTIVTMPPSSITISASYVTAYTLAVTNGTGGGSSYTNGQSVAVTANPPATGMAFDRWTGDTNYVTSVTSTNTTVTMPAANIAISATYSNLYYTLTVNSGIGGGTYTNGQQVAITASNVVGMLFDRWTGATQQVASVTSPGTTVTMPASNIVLTATYVKTYTLTVVSGSTSGTYTNGQQVAIVASNLTGKIFDRWTGDIANVASVTSPNTTVTMPTNDITLTATYLNVYTLTVTSGDGGGTYTNKQQVTVTASNLTGKVFDRWTGSTVYVANPYASSTIVTMPAGSIAITATYVTAYTLAVTNGTGGGSSYTNGQVIAVGANNPLTGMAFARWTGDITNVASVTSQYTTVRMPAANIAISATYSNLYYTLTVTSGSGSGTYTNGRLVSVTANARADRTFDKWTGDIGYLASATSSTTTVTMPAGAVSIAATYTVTTSTLTENRILTFNDYALTNNTPTPTWRHEGTTAPSGLAGTPQKALLKGTNHYHRTGWVLRFCRTGSSAYMLNALSVPPVSPATLPADPYMADNLAANMQNDYNALIESPVLTNGAGTVYFEAINSDPTYPTEITVEIATNMTNSVGSVIGTINPPSTNGYAYVWQTLNVLNLNATVAQPAFTRYARLLNFRQPVKLRIRRTGTIYTGFSTLDNAFAVIDNIRVSPPPSDVTISKTSIPFEPGYPSVGTNITVRCYVSDVDPHAPTDLPRPMKIVYRWHFLDQVIGAWRTNAMSYVAGTGDGAGNGERYAAVLPAFSDVGDLEYYFIGDFVGTAYLSPDYTGTGSAGVPAGAPVVFPYKSESLSPRMLRYGDDGKDFSTRLRPYASRYGALYAETDQLNDPVGMALSGNGEWRALVPLAGTGVTNLTWRFRAVDEYVPGSEQISTGVTFWAGVGDLKGGHVPYGGICVATNETGRLNVGVDSGNYAMLTLNTESLQYLATRAEYQNFNKWSAPENYFSESNGQDPKSSFENNFDAWDANVFGTTLNSEGQGTAFEPLNLPTTITNSYSRSQFTTAYGWAAGSAAYVSERPFDTVYEVAGYYNFRNLALRLKGGDSALGLGYVHNMVASLPDGLKEFSFNCRLGQGARSTDVAYYRNGFTGDNYGVLAYPYALANGMSPETPSLSLIGHYQDADHFYEYRITQIKDSRDTESVVQDKASLHELYKWVNGVPTLLKSYTLLGARLDIGASINMRFYNTDANTTLIKCTYVTTEVLSCTDSALPHIRTGSVGVLSADCQSVFGEIYLQPTDSTATLTGSASAILNNALYDTNAQYNDWYVPVGRFTLRGDINPKGIYSVTPIQQLGVYVQDTVFGSDTEPSEQVGGAQGWRLVKTVQVKNFSYQTNTVAFNSWQAQFVMLQVLGGASTSNQADVAVDEFGVSSWHGIENGKGNHDRSEWVATESWVIPSTVAGLNEGKLAGAFNTTEPNPKTAVQLTTRYANTGAGWSTDATYVYTGHIWINNQTNTFGESFNGNVLLKINGVEILNDTNPTNTTTKKLVLPPGYYPFELRVGNGSSSAGPYGGGLGGYGVAYINSSTGTTWLPLTDTGSGLFLWTTVNQVQLDHSRADPTKDQAIRSPVILTGLGQMEFDYYAYRVPAKLTVQWAPSGDTTDWQPVQSFVVTNVGGWTHASAYLGLSQPGYFRLLNERSGIYTNAFVEIDNAVVWDEPPVTNNSWRAYNAKITQSDTKRLMLDGTEACFLNNSKTAEVSPSQDTFEPYLKSPVLPKGLGTLSFYARAYTNTQAATLYIFATTSGWNAPDDQWNEVTRFDNITNTLYRLFTYQPEDGRAYNAIKLCKKTTDGTGRVCLDEVVASEPIFPGFDIVNVKLLVRKADGSYGTREQPLDGEDLDVEARMGNIQLTPSNIAMHVSYYVGTNAWGIGNWPASQVVTRRMHPVDGDSTLFRTRPDNGGVTGLPESEMGGILGQDPDQVVQYYVWATYTGGISLNTQQDTFDNPAWYYPVDLNATFASRGWSPYFFVYGVPAGAVWINEINATDYVTDSNNVQQLGIWDNQYIEIAVPAWLDLAGWSVDLVNGGYVTHTIKIPSGLPTQTAVTNGYAFFVIGDAAPPAIPGTPALPKMDYGYPSLSSFMPRITPGGLRLKRPLGMYEQAIAYEWDPKYGPAFSGSAWAAGDPERKFIFVGKENNNGSLGRVGLTDSTNTWVFPQAWTPGSPNADQMLPAEGAYVPGVSNIIVSSVMSLAKGTQNGKRTALYSLRMRKGTWTNIVYQVDAWYRLSSLTSNQVQQLPAGSALQSYNLVLTNLQANVDVAAGVQLRSDLAEFANDSTVLNWVLGFSDGALIPMYYNNRLLSMTEQYWLNANPTVSNTFQCAITKFVTDPGTNFHVKVEMALNGVKKTSFQGTVVLKLQAKSHLTDAEWQLLAQYSLSSASFDASNTCRVFVPNPFAYMLYGADPQSLFFRWVIEQPDPRVGIQALVDQADDLLD